MMKTESTGRREGFAATLLGTLALIAIAATGFSACINPLTSTAQTARAEAASPHLSATSAAGALAADGVLSFPDTGELSSAPLTVTIGNTGQTSLSINVAGITIAMGTGTTAGSFTLQAPPPATIAAGRSAAFVLCFTPQTLGANTATVVLPTNDVNYPKFTFTVKGNGTNQAPTPVFTGGNLQCWPLGYDSAVTITCSNPSATIYYTTNGSVPSLASIGSTTFKYTGPFFFSFNSGAGTVQAMATVTGMTNSATVVADFSMTSVATPTFTVPSTTFMSNAAIPVAYGITSSTSGATVYIAFTIDGTAPNPLSTPTPFITTTTPSTANGTGTYIMPSGSSFLYGGVHANGMFTLNAVAFVQSGSGTDFTSNTTATATYSFQMSLPAFATAQPQAAYYASPPSVALSCASGSGGTASIYYATTAAPPVTSANGTQYSGAITVPEAGAGSVTNETVQAIAYETNWLPSAILTGVFNVCGPGVWNSSNWDQATWQ